MKKYITILIASTFLFTACRKEWLDAKPNKSLVVPSTIADYQALLDNTTVFKSNLGNTELATNDYLTTAAIWQSSDIAEQRIYMWNNDPFQGRSLSAGDWVDAYTRILHENIVLEGLEKVRPIDAAYNNVKGTALFYRAFDFFSLAQEFCKPFSANTFTKDLGIPLRLTANINDKAVRATVTETYTQIITDLKTAINFLPQIPVYKTRPSVPSVYGMLSRVYLSMEDYTNAEMYADSCLQIYNKLLDYNTLNASAPRPFAQFNDEVIFDWQLATYGMVSTGTVVPELYKAYDINDLRLGLFFTSTQVFKGSYEGTNILFNGLATDEIYLIRAECRARGGRTADALEDLNTLLIKRYKAGQFTPITGTNSFDVLSRILLERRKELVFRGLRWTDLRRLNQDNRFATMLSRTLNGTSYTLPPNDLRYVFLIPQNEILISGIEQNPR